MKGAEAEYLSPDDEANSVDSVDIFPHQVGGHHLIVKHPSRPDLIVKPHFSKETQFYQDAQGDPLLQEIVAKYYGELFLPLLGGTYFFFRVLIALRLHCIRRFDLWDG